MRILIVEDEKNLNKILKRHFQAEGFVTDCCFDGEEAVDFMISYAYDIVLLDMMLPKMDGYEVLKTVRKRGIDIPIIALTAKTQVSDIIKGLDYGADDYIKKPFDFDELMARIRVLMRRDKGISDHIYECGDLRLDSKTHKVSRSGRELTLTPKEYNLLELLMRNKNIVMTREQIASNLWDIDLGVQSNAVDVYIRYLRRKIDDGFEKKLIHTVRGVGYTIRC